MINADNDAPTADAGTDQFVNEGDEVTLSGTGSDPENQALTYQWIQTSGPEVVLSDPTSPTPTFFAPEGTSDSEITFELQVSDGTNTSVDTVSVSIDNVHADPLPFEVTVPDEETVPFDGGVATNVEPEAEPDNTSSEEEEESLWDGTENLEVMDPTADLNGELEFGEPLSPGREVLEAASDAEPRFVSDGPEFELKRSPATDSSSLSDIKEQDFESVFTVEKEDLDDQETFEPAGVIAGLDLEEAEHNGSEREAASDKHQDVELYVTEQNAEVTSEQMEAAEQSSGGFWAAIWGLLRGSAGTNKRSDEAEAKAARQSERGRRN